MSSPSSAEPVTTNSGSLWLQNKEQLHRLYIIENKTLAQVKDAMESEHGFPVLRLHDYEVALRDVLKLRKNLKKDDWHSIGIHLSNRKREGKESEVVWNGVPLPAKKVRKDVLRNRKVNQLCYRSRTGELPVGVVIRTPPGSPSRQLAVIGPPEGLCLSPEQVTPTSHVNLQGILQVESLNWDINAGHLEPAQVEISRFRNLRKNIPFNRFMSEFLKNAKSHPSFITLSVEPSWTPGPRLFGDNPSLDMLARSTYHLSNRMQIDWTSNDNKWFLNWLGVSADFMVLKLFFSIKTPTVCAAYERLCHLAKIIEKSTIARVLFEIRDTVKKNSSMTADGVDFLAIAVHIGSSANGMLEVARRELHSHAESLHMSKIWSLFLLAASHRDIAIMRLLVNAISCSDGRIDPGSNGTLGQLALIIRQVCLWEPDEQKDGATLADYVQLLIQGRILLTSLSARCCYSDRPEVVIRNPESLMIDELVMLCPPMKRRNLYSAILPWSNDHTSFVSKAGVFATAPEGSQSVRQYLRSCEQNDKLEIHATMQECLLFAASLNDTQTASAMLQLGVDPRVPLLLDNHELYHKGNLSWNPMIVAAATGSLETLQMLGETTDLGLFLKAAPVYEVMRLSDHRKYWDITGRELCRLDNFRRVVTYSKTRYSDAAVANGAIQGSCDLGELNENASLGSFVTRTRRMETIAWIRTIAAACGMVNSIDKEIIAAALFIDPATQGMEGSHETYHPCDVLMLDGLVDANLDYHEGDMDLLQLSIRAECGLKVVELLISKGLRVHSRAAKQSGNTMLHDALLSQSHDRSKIVQLLLQEGAEYTQCGEGLTVLEASLQIGMTYTSPWDSRRVECIDIFTRLFEAGAPVRRPARPQVEGLQSLVCCLIDRGAEDSLITRVVEAGADLNERACGDLQGCRPLEVAIMYRRENLARELIRRGADVHAPAGDGAYFTALQAACLGECSLEFVEYLVRLQGANANEAPCKYGGMTALQAAAYHGSLSVAEFLLDNGADVNAFSAQPISEGLHFLKRALDYASSWGRLDMVEFLLKAGGRSGTGGLDGAIRATKMFGCSAVRSVLLDWEKKHGGRIVEEEVEWQRQHPDTVPLVLEV